jgi:hypothetical protein
MTLRSNGSSYVHPVHQPATHQVAKYIGIIGQHDLRHQGETVGGFFYGHERILNKDRRIRSRSCSDHLLLICMQYVFMVKRMILPISKAWYGFINAILMKLERHPQQFPQQQRLFTNLLKIFLYFPISNSFDP